MAAAIFAHIAHTVQLQYNQLMITRGYTTQVLGSVQILYKYNIYIYIAHAQYMHIYMYIHEPSTI